MATLPKSRLRPVGVLLSKVPRWPIQLASLIIAFSYYLPGLKKVPCLTLNCSVCPAMVFGCPVRFFQDAAFNRLTALYSLGVLAAVGALIGSLSCGWFCPFGLFQDWLYKIKTPKLKLDNHFNRTRYGILIILVGIVPFLTLTTWFCKLCPAGTLEAVIPQTIINLGNPTYKIVPGYMFIIEIIILVLFLAWMVFSKRPFCRLACPIGTIYSVFNRFSRLRVKVDMSRCIQCNKCQKTCPVEIKIYQNPGSSNCIQCMECIKACPKSAIST